VVGSDLAYGVLEGGLVRYDGGDWGPLPSVVQPVHELSRLWATPTKLFATSYASGKIYTLTGNTLAVEDTRTLARFTTIWGFADDDVWAGTEGSTLYHYDGTSWSAVQWPASASCTYDSGIQTMWGADGVLYFSSQSRIGRVVNGQVETLAELGCDNPTYPVYITSIWGRSRDEVFISLVDQSLPQQECGATFLLYYDGNEFHRF
jgi:hypothetical protein